MANMDDGFRVWGEGCTLTPLRLICYLLTTQDFAVRLPKLARSIAEWNEMN